MPCPINDIVFFSSCYIKKPQQKIKQLRYDLNFIDVIHITTVFLASNDKIISKI